MVAKIKALIQLELLSNLAKVLANSFAHQWMKICLPLSFVFRRANEFAIVCFHINVVQIILCEWQISPAPCWNANSIYS
jgi:hypothetical protein